MEKVKLDKLVVDGVTYVPETEKQEPDGEWVIVRTYSAGVFFGKIASRDGKECVMSVARRLWYWDGSASLSQMAIDGTSKPQNCKFPCETFNVVLTEVIEIIPCTKKAVKSIQGVIVWVQ